jgi:hypothetical protein
MEIRIRIMSAARKKAFRLKGVVLSRFLANSKDGLFILAADSLPGFVP